MHEYIETLTSIDRMSQPFVDYRFSFCISHEFDVFYVNVASVPYSN